MKSHTQVVVIGGGVVGCSVLYHLTKAGWKDVTLIERSELTSGSSWHAAGGFHTLNSDPNVAKLQAYTVGLYKEIEAISGQSCGLHLTGGLQLADTPERLDWLKMAHARGRYLGMETEIISAAEAKKLLPLIDEKYFVGALWDPIEGHLDPYGTTHAYAKSARIAGAEIVLHNRVTELVHNIDGTWKVVTEQGTIEAEHVVNAGGLWAREIGRMVGLELPVLAMEHHYILTEDMPEVAEISARDRQGDGPRHRFLRRDLYATGAAGPAPRHLREGGDAVVAEGDAVGFRAGPARAEPRPHRAVAGSRLQAFPGAGEDRHPPRSSTAPSPSRRTAIRSSARCKGVRNFWCACAVMAGFSQGGGVGLALSNWMIDGDPGFDVWAMDVARFGDWATLGYTNAKVRENYSRRFRIRFPNEELPAARPMQTTALYDKMIAQGAVMGDSWGLETPLWFAPKGVEPKDIVSFRRSNDFPHVKAECRAVRERVGITEIANFAKYSITGPGAEAFLSRVMTNRMPKTGRIMLSPMLNEKGKLIGDFTIAKAGDDRFMMWGSSQAQIYHMRWFERHLPADKSVAIRPLGMDLVGLSIAGPRARDVLAKLTDEDVSSAAFRFLDFRETNLASVPVMVNRVTYTGDLGYEIWVAPEYQRRLYEKVMEAGEEFGIANFGMRALLSLRLEKNWPTWFRELRPIYGPFEADVGRFVDLKKNDFIGREKAAEEKESGGTLRRVTFAVDADDADVLGDEPIWHDGKVVGWVTSGGYAHFVERSLAQGYVPKELVANGGDFEIEIIGERRRAAIEPEPLFDPEGARMRG